MNKNSKNLHILIKYVKKLDVINSIVDIFKTPEITQTFFEIKLKDIVKTKQN